MNMKSNTLDARRAAFWQLHESGCFLIPNPWDRGSAIYLASLGFKALATTSTGYAWSHGRADGQVSLDEVLGYLREMVDATDLPVNADFESGFAQTPEELAQNVTRAIETGVAGLSIEDATRHAEKPLYDIDEAVERMAAAREAIDASGQHVMLIGRAENFFVGRPDLDDAIGRLQAYAKAGADCLYAPALQTPEQIRAVVQAVAPKPVNVLMGWAGQLKMSDLAALGVRRVSVGGAMALSAWGGFQRAARLLAEQGSFEGFRDKADGHALQTFFSDF